MTFKTTLLVGGLLVACSASVFAYDAEDQHIISAATKNAVTIAQATKSIDETAVSVTGTIVRMVKREHYEIKDSTGTITVEIDDHLVKPNQLKKGTKVRVYGEVDTHRIKPVDIDAVKVEIL